MLLARGAPPPPLTALQTVKPALPPSPRRLASFQRAPRCPPMSMAGRPWLRDAPGFMNNEPRLVRPFQGLQVQDRPLPLQGAAASRRSTKELEAWRPPEEADQ